MGLLDETWANGEPYRVALGGLLQGDTETASKILKKQLSEWEKKPAAERMLAIALGFAPFGVSNVSGNANTYKMLQQMEAQRAAQEAMRRQSEYFARQLKDINSMPIPGMQ